jgi:hypothetical protein
MVAFGGAQAEKEKEAIQLKDWLSTLEDKIKMLEDKIKMLEEAGKPKPGCCSGICAKLCRGSCRRCAARDEECGAGQADATDAADATKIAITT